MATFWLDYNEHKFILLNCYESSVMPKVAIVTNLVTPYRTRQFALINDHLKGKLNVYFTDRLASDRKWKIEPKDYYFFLPTLFRVGVFGRLNAGLLKIVRDHDYVVIGGYEQPTYIVLALLCKLTTTPYIVIFDGIAPSRIAHSGNYLARRIKQWILKNATACFANGTVARQYIQETLCISGLPLFNQYLSIYAAEIIAAKLRRDSLRSEFFRSHNLPSSTRIILYSGRLIARKRVDDLIDALKNTPTITLLVAGHGPEEFRLRSLCATLNVTALFCGHLEQENLAKMYAMADCLVLPSVDEPWGLVVNEALFAGIPVVVSDDCGCGPDLVIPKKNGFIFPAGNVRELAASIDQALALDIPTVEATAAALMQQWSLENSAESFFEMLTTDSKKHLLNSSNLPTNQQLS